jgi:endonuclease G
MNIKIISAIKNRYVLLSVSFLMCISSCTMDEIVHEPDVALMPVLFSTAVDMPRIRTSADGNQWDSADRIGIFMLTSSGALPGSIIQNADNRQYAVFPESNAATAFFTPADADADKIYYPQTGNVDFIAYSPYKPTGANGISNAYTYPIDISDQSDPEALNFMYAKTANVSRSHDAVELDFIHLLSKLTLNIVKGTGMENADLTNAKATINGMSTTADFALTDGSLTPGQVTSFQARKTPTASGYDATFEALIIPSSSGSRSVVFQVGSIRFKWVIPDNAILSSGKRYSYDLTISAN